YLFNEIDKRKIDFHVVIGNHDTFHRNSNRVNSPELLLSGYDTIKVYSSPQNVKIGDLDFAFLPWICSENYEESMEFINSTKSQVLMGHLELKGFEMYRGSVNEHGMASSVFDKFDEVYSGHFHTRSKKGNITYLG